MVSAVVTGSGSALPATLDQEAAWEGFFARHYEGVRAAQRIFAGAGVRTRHAVANPIDEDISGWSTGARMARECAGRAVDPWNVQGSGLTVRD